MTVRIVTLGCKVNQAESQALAGLFSRAGFTPVKEGPADVVVVNSCTVTREADRKTRQAVRRLRRENPGALLALTGCLPQASPGEAEEIGEADLVTGTRDRSRLPELVERCLTGGGERMQVSGYDGGETFDGALQAGRFDKSFQKAYLKVEDGCDRCCAYCVIPRARGRVRSQAPEEIRRRARELAGNGYREIILTGINLSRYGADRGLCLADAAEAAAGCGARLRLGSLECDLITREMWDRLARVEGLCPQFHLALQSGCDATLRRMGRRYDTRRYRDALAAARERFPDAQITTDLIAGFPGESGEEFEETCGFVREIGLLRAHVFVFSPRPHTPAAGMAGQVPRQEAARRAKILTDICAGSGAAITRTYLGRTLQVLCEATGTGYADNGLEVLLPPGAPVGEVRPYRIAGTKGSVALAEPEDEKRENREEKV